MAARLPRPRRPPTSSSYRPVDALSCRVRIPLGRVGAPTGGSDTISRGYARDSSARSSDGTAQVSKRDRVLSRRIDRVPLTAKLVVLLPAHRLCAFRRQPLPVQCLLYKFLVKVRTYQVFECKCDFAVLALAVTSPTLWQVFLFHDMRKSLGIGAVGNAQQIEETLRRHTVHI